MKQITYIIGLCLLVTFSCFDDIGNYNYSKLPEITINNVPPKLGDYVSFEDTIKVTPIVSLGTAGNIDNLEYRWYRKIGEGSTAKLELFIEEKNLVLPVTESGTIAFVFEVKNKQTGVKKLAFTSAKGISKMSKGLFLLKETSDGSTEIDMISSDTSMTHFDHHEDLVASLTGSALPGLPVALDYWGFRYEDFETAELRPIPSLRVVSQDDILVIGTDKFDELARFEDLFLGDVPTVRNIQKVKSIREHTILINNDEIYSATNYHIKEEKPSGWNKFSLAKTGDYKVSPHLCWPSVDNAPRFMAFDTKSGLFKYIDPSLGNLRDVMYSSVLSLDSIDAELLFIEGIASSARNYDAYCLFHRNDAPDSIMFIQFDPMGLAWGNRVRVKNIHHLKANDYLLDNATNWCVHQQFPTIYFTIGNKLYKYDVNLKTEELLLTFDEDITYLDMVTEYYIHDSQVDQNGEPVMISPLTSKYIKLVVATGNGEDYSFYKYNMPAGSIVPDAEPYFTAKGSGTIKGYIYIKPESIPTWMRTLK